jgi:hypothetical protein
MRRLFLFLLLFAGLSWSADTGWHNGTSFTTGCEGALWVNPTNAQYSDGSFSTVTAARRMLVDAGCLTATGYGFSIPTGSTIDGILVRIRKHGAGSGGSVNDISMGISLGGNDKGKVGSWATSATDYDYGGATDKWSLTPTPAEINSADFGAYISAIVAASATASQVAYIDWIGIKVYYTPPASAGKPMRSYISGPGYMIIDGLQNWGVNMPKVEGLWKKLFWLWY